MSMMRSASSMICGSCSTTSSELPASRSRFMTAITRCMSRGCRPIEGSSSTNSVFTSEVPSAVVRLMRWTSPPESVRDCRSSVRYARPTSARNPVRLRSSVSSRSVAWSSGAGSSSPRKNASTRSTGSSIRSCRHRPGMRIQRLLAPLHALRPEPRPPAERGLGERMAADPPQQAVGAQARAVAGIAGRVGAIAREQHAHVHLVGARFEPIEIALDAVPVALLPGSLAVDHPLAFRLGQFAPGPVQVDAALLRMLLQILLAFLVGLGLPGPHGALRASDLFSSGITSP